MRGRFFFPALVAGLLTSSPDAFAQGKDRVWRVGFLSPRRHLAPPDADYYDELPRGLRELGYVEGKNLEIQWRFADGKYDRLQGLAAGLVAERVDLIVADGTASVLAAQKETQTIPIVFPSAGDPVGNGLVKTLARPGGNTTGISLLAGDSIANKQLEMLSTLLPGLSRVGIIHNPDNPYSTVALRGLRTGAEALKLTLLTMPVRTPLEIDTAFRKMTEQGAGASIWIADAFLNQQSRQLADLGVKHHLPGMGAGAPYSSAGGLISYGSDNFDNYRRAAAIVDAILRGANPADLPVQQPTKFHLVINRKAAKAFGLDFPPELLVLADKVID